MCILSHLSRIRQIFCCPLVHFLPTPSPCFFVEFLLCILGNLGVRLVQFFPDIFSMAIVFAEIYWVELLTKNELNKVMTRRAFLRHDYVYRCQKRPHCDYSHCDNECLETTAHWLPTQLLWPRVTWNNRVMTINLAIVAMSVLKEYQFSHCVYDCSKLTVRRPPTKPLRLSVFQNNHAMTINLAAAIMSALNQRYSD